MRTAKKLLALLIAAIVVVGILAATGVIPKDMIFPAAAGGVDEFGPVIPDTVSTNEIVNGWFHGTHDCHVKVDGSMAINRTPASSLEECVEIGKGIDGAIVAGFRNGDHPGDEYKNTCYFHTCMPPGYDKNDTIQKEDLIHTMTCINYAENFEDCI